MHLQARHAALHTSATAGVVQTLPATRHLQPIHQRARCRNRHVDVQAIYIDRRQHMEIAWQTQMQREAVTQGGASTPGVVTEIQDIQHLEQLLERSGSSLVVIYFYSRSCGACKQALRCFEELCKEVGAYHALGSGPRLIHANPWLQSGRSLTWVCKLRLLSLTTL